MSELFAFRAKRLSMTRTRKPATGSRRGQERPPPDNLDHGCIADNIEGTLAIWRKKDGRDVFTGIVRLPVASPDWLWLGYSFCHAELVNPPGTDGDRQSFGPSRVISPCQFLERMKLYD